MYDWTNTSPELESSDVDTAVLMIGAIEQHGPHLPISVDWFVGEVVARGVAERLDAFLLPGLPFGNSHPHHGFRGSISLSFDTLDRVVKDIALSLIDQGFRRIAVINFNGGNIMVKVTCRDINMSQDRGKVVQLHPSIVAGERLSHVIDSLSEEVHAGEFETSLMMHIAPEQVGPQRIDHVPDVGPSDLDYRPLREFCPDGIWGRSSLAAKEKGEQGLDILIDAAAVEFEEAFARLGVPTT